MPCAKSTYSIPTKQITFDTNENVLQYFDGVKWLDIPIEKSNRIVKVHCFPAVQGNKVRVMINKFYRDQQLLNSGFILKIKI